MHGEVALSPPETGVRALAAETPCQSSPHLTRGQYHFKYETCHLAFCMLLSILLPAFLVAAAVLMVTMLASRFCGLPTLGALPILALLFASVSSMTETNGVLFLFPTQGVTLHYNDYVQVQYISNFTDPWLFTFCRDADGNVGGE